MTAKTMRAQHQSICAATGRKVAKNTVIFKSVLGWAILDAESFAAVRQAVAEGRTTPGAQPAGLSPRSMAARIAADPDALARMMDREDSSL